MQNQRIKNANQQIHQINKCNWWWLRRSPLPYKAIWEPRNYNWQQTFQQKCWLMHIKFIFFAYVGHFMTIWMQLAHTVLNSNEEEACLTERERSLRPHLNILNQLLFYAYFWVCTCWLQFPHFCCILDITETPCRFMAWTLGLSI